MANKLARRLRRLNYRPSLPQVVLALMLAAGAATLFYLRRSF